MQMTAIRPATAVDIGPRLARYALSRLGFGPRPGQIRQVLAQGLQRYVEEQLDPAPDPDLETRLRGLRTLDYPIAQVLALNNADDRAIGPIVDEFVAAKLIRAAHARNQLQEVLVDFWFNHFNVNIGDGFVRYSVMSYERDAIRPHVLGRFRDLLGATATHPAMLYYLDNYLSAATRYDASGRLIQGINENYGRELMELHTVGVDAGYTQEHVFDSARCFTGWGIDNLRTSGAFVYRPAQHDTGAKSVFGLNVPAGGGRDDGEKLLDYLAAHPSTARFISKKLAERFVADVPPSTLLDKMAAAFQGSGGDLREVLRRMIDSPEFWAGAFGPGKPRTGFELTVAALRAADAQVTSSRGAAAAVSAMGMPLYQCIPPTGYSNRGDDWLDPSSQLNRMNFALDLSANAVAGAAVDARATVRSASGNPDDARSVAAALDADLFGTSLSAATLGAISRLAAGGPVSIATRGLGLCLASPEMQTR
jgi:uncharacterized protein (DUF1800 family)